MYENSFILPWHLIDGLPGWKMSELDIMPPGMWRQHSSVIRFMALKPEFNAFLMTNLLYTLIIPHLLYWISFSIYATRCSVDTCTIHACILLSPGEPPYVFCQQFAYLYFLLSHFIWHSFTRYFFFCIAFLVSCHLLFP